jgi:archaemetzincin
VPDEDLDAVEAGAGWLGITFRRLSPMPDPAYAFDARRGQYNSVEVMQTLGKNTPADGSKVIGVTERDLFIPMLTFVFGQAQLGGRLALVSLARLRQQFYGLPGDQRLLIGRALKETLHELGHTLGLVHCNDSRCAMSLSTGIQQVDRKDARYCGTCARVLRDGGPDGFIPDKRSES